MSDRLGVSLGKNGGFEYFCFFNAQVLEIRVGGSGAHLAATSFASWKEHMIVA